MAISYQIPQTARYISTSNIFTATFNNPTAGKYDFGIAGNMEVSILELFQNTVYLIDRISIGGNISDSDFLSSIETLPLITFKTLQKKQIVYKLPFPVVNYIDDQDVTAWIISEKGGNSLICDFTGVLNQTADLVGITDIKINVSLSIYAIESTRFYSTFRGDLSPDVGKQVMGAIK